MNNDLSNNEEVRVLLCDDQEIVGIALKQMLIDQKNLILFHLLDPKLILKTITEFKPTVLLQDLVLPDTSGIEIVSLLRAKSELRDLPIILLSTTDDAKTKFEAFNAGASDYVVKFPEAFELIGRINYHSRAYQNLVAHEQAQQQLQQRSKLESLGNLAAGIAHEINTPLQYISANLSYLQECLQSQSDKIPESGEMIEALRETSEGVSEISKIVRAMKAFAHPGKQEKVTASINEVLNDIAVISRNEWKDYATLVLELDKDLPAVICNPGAIAQVVLNLIVNSAQAIKARTSTEIIAGLIKVASRKVGGEIEIEINDNGGGIPEEVRDRVFDPFFTTKDIGVGSGQGLSLARTMIVEGHGGKLEFETKVPVGTSFYVRLPLTKVETKVAV